MVGSLDCDTMNNTVVQSGNDLLVRLFAGIERNGSDGQLPEPLIANRIPTQLADFDALTQGLQRGSLVVIAGTTGMGKTSLALNLARNICIDSQIPVLYVTNDSPPKQLVVRMLASISSIESGRIGAARLSEAEWTKLGEACSLFGGASLFFLDHPEESLRAIKEQCLTLQAKECGIPGVVIVDQLQLMPEFYGPESPCLDTLLRDLRQLAVDLNLCLILLCQTPPSPELRDNHRPLLNDLPGILAMQAYAHVISFLHREEFWEPNISLRGQTEMIFFKNVDNPVGMFKMMFVPQLSHFTTPESASHEIGFA